MRGNGLVIIGGIVVIALIVWIVYSGSVGAAPIASATLIAANGSGINGTASIVPSSDGKATSITVELNGLRTGQIYSATVNSGNCLGTRLFLLNGVTGDPSGQGTSSTTVPAPPNASWFVAVHASASGAAPLVACGQVRVTSLPAAYQQPGRVPYQLPNGGGGAPRTPLPAPAR
ncbi:MAG TPA: hypothetical protein VID73_13290 [Ktedonobacterales bacterium]